MKLLSLAIVPVLLLSACIKDKTPSSHLETTVTTNTEGKKPTTINNNIIVQESVATGKNSIAVNSLENLPKSHHKTVQKAVATGENSQALNAGGDITIK